MTISLIAAFLGGVLSLLSPCSALVLPTFFATGFKQRRKILFATVIFSAGLMLMLFPLGLGVFGLWRLLSFYRRPITLTIGVLLVLAAAALVFGRHISFPGLGGRLLPKKGSVGYSSAFNLGVVSGVGSSACIGPVFGAIITLAASSTNLIAASMLMIAYALGLVAPLFGLAFFWDRYGLAKIWWVRGKMIRLGKLKVHSTNFISGLLLLGIAYVFIRYQGSLGFAPIFTKTGVLDTLFDIQDRLFGL